MHFFLAILLVYAWINHPNPLYAGANQPCQYVTIRALDKITANVSEITLKTQETAVFGTPTITLSQCLRNGPEDPPEALAFLNIKETKPDKSIIDVFRGWMFASRPALWALEHPVYDVWVKEGGGTLQPSSGDSGGPDELKESSPLPSSPLPLPESDKTFIDPEALPENSVGEAHDAIAALYRGLDRPQAE